MHVEDAAKRDMCNLWEHDAHEHDKQYLLQLAQQSFAQLRACCAGAPKAVLLKYINRGSNALSHRSKLDYIEFTDTTRSQTLQADT